MKTQKMTIDNSTKVSLFAILFALPTLFGGVLWLTSIDATAKEAKEASQGATQMLIQIDQRLSRIEGALGTNK